ncbi:putative rhomboid protease [Rhizina undulata]
MSVARDPRAMAIAASSHQMWKKLEGYVLRLPVLTKVVALLIAVVHFLVMFGVPIAEYFALDPKKMDLGQMHRLNTYPLVHIGLLHAVFNIVALTPLLERFEREVGTLKTLLLILGPLVTFPGMLYLALEFGVFQSREAVAGASALVFTLLGIEAVKTFAFRPYYSIGGYDFPTWATPIAWMVVIAFLAPSSSFVGHFCGLIIGYLYACRYLRLLEPSEWVLSKVESKLHFLFSRIPHYVSLEKRTEMNYWEFLPTVNYRAARIPTSPAPGQPMSTFANAGPGRPLGS